MMALILNFDETKETETLARHVRERRRGLGMTPEQLAQLAGLDVSYIGSIESGQANPTLLVLSRLAKILGLSVADLLR